jgi:hypothetical protein
MSAPLQKDGALMEPSGGKRWQTVGLEGRKNRPETAPLSASVCHRSLPRRHGKEGVDGSSPSEGLQNPRSRGFFVQDDLLFVVRAVGMELFMELSRRERRASSVVRPLGAAVRTTGCREDRPPIGIDIESRCSLRTSS